jgi:MFS family permease
MQYTSAGREFVGTDGAAANRVGRPWLAVGLLCFLFAASFVDRMILALLIEPIRADLGVSETQLAILFGLGFSLAYVTAGLPLGHLADRGNRRTLLIGGVLVWSAATVAAGFADSFATLAITRAGVGIGEAVLTPVAISMIADLFAPQRRALPTSIFSTVGAAMGSGSLIIGGGAVWLAERLGADLGIEAWRLTFIIVAVPGLLGAIAFAIAVPEPERGVADRDQASLGAAIAHLRANIRLYAGMFLGVGLMLTQAMGLVAWGPTMLMRQHGLSAAEAGAAFGGAAVVGSMTGALSVPFLLRRLAGHSPTDSILIAAFAYALVTAPAASLAIASGRFELVLIGIGIGLGGLAAGAVLPSLLVQAATPARLRGRAMAVYLLLSNLLSLGLGPVLVTWFAGPGGDLAHALAWTGGATLTLACACYLLALTRQPHRSDM